MMQTDDRTRTGRWIGGAGVAVNLLLFLVKWFTGKRIGALSITADAFNNLGDAATALVALLGFALAERPADREHPYGHARYEYIAAFIVSAIVMAVGFELLHEAIERILQPQAVKWTGKAVGVLCLSILVKLTLAAFYRVTAQRLDADVFRASAADSLSDAGATFAVLLGGIFGRSLGLSMDGWLSLFIAVLILLQSVMLCRDTISPLLGRVPDAKEVDALRNRILSGEYVIGMHDLQIHDYGQGHRFASAHVEIPASLSALEGHAVIDKIERETLKESGIHLVLHSDPVSVDDPRVLEFKERLKEIAVSVCPEATIHDLRIIPGSEMDKVLFDCVIPYESGLSEREMEGTLVRAFEKRYGKRYDCIPTVEHSFTGEE